MQPHPNVLPSRFLHAPQTTVDTAQDVLPEPLTQALHAETTVQTATGVQKLSTLCVGQHLLTRDGTFQPVTRIDRVTFTQRQLHDMPKIAPIRFDPGALPDMSDEVALLASPDCSIARSQGPAGVERFPARAFCDGGLIRAVIPDEGICYICLHFDTPHQILVSGIWVEFTPDDTLAPELPQEVPQLVHEIRIFRPLRA